MEILQSQLGGALIPELSKQVNAPEDQTSAATNGILSTLIGALSKNASTPEGAASLNNALEQDHDGGILDNIMGLLGGQIKQGSLFPFVLLFNENIFNQDQIQYYLSLDEFNSNKWTQIYEQKLLANLSK